MKRRRPGGRGASEFEATGAIAVPAAGSPDGRLALDPAGGEADSTQKGDEAAADEHE